MYVVASLIDTSNHHVYSPFLPSSSSISPLDLADHHAPPPSTISPLCADERPPPLSKLISQSDHAYCGKAPRAGHATANPNPALRPTGAPPPRYHPPPTQPSARQGHHAIDTIHRRRSPPTGTGARPIAAFARVTGAPRHRYRPPPTQPSDRNGSTPHRRLRPPDRGTTPSIPSTTDAALASIRPRAVATSPAPSSPLLPLLRAPPHPSRAIRTPNAALSTATALPVSPSTSNTHPPTARPANMN